MNNDIRPQLERFESFMVTPQGRLLRVGLGVGLIAAGLMMRKKEGYALAGLGLIPLAAGGFDYCLLAPLINGPFEGEKMRRYLENPHAMIH